MLLLFVYAKGSSYRIHFWFMSKNDAITIMNNSNFVDKKGVFLFYLTFFINILKVNDLSCYQKAKKRC